MLNARGWYGKMAVCLVAVVATVSVSRSNAADVTVWGSGTTRCSEWINDRKKPSGDLLRTQGQAWVLGYLSGWTVLANVDYLKKADPDTIFQAMDQQCQAKPSQLIAEAVAVLARALRN